MCKWLRALFYCVSTLSFLSLYAHAPIQEKVVICGVCRDIGKKLPEIIQSIEVIGNLFENYRVVISEYNSDDNTPTILYQWMRRNSKVQVRTAFIPDASFKTWVINVTNDKQFFFPEQNAHARNRILDTINSQEYADFPFVIWVDMDHVITPALEGIVEVFQSKIEWDAVFGYGIDQFGKYKDWNSHRDHVYPIGAELLGASWACIEKTCELFSDSEWYPVYSAFGGVGIYKKSSILGCEYSALVTNDLAKLDQRLIDQDSLRLNPLVMKYVGDLNNYQEVYIIKGPHPDLPLRTNPSIGIRLPSLSPQIIWKVNFPAYQYPTVCEHVAFHASMIVRGHHNLFINPRLLVTYSE